MTATSMEAIELGVKSIAGAHGGVTLRTNNRDAYCAIYYDTETRVFRFVGPDGYGPFQAEQRIDAIVYAYTLGFKVPFRSYQPEQQRIQMAALAQMNRQSPGRKATA